MKEEYEHTKTINSVEYIMIIIVLLAILIILVPALSKIIYNVSQNASMTSTQGIIDSVKAYYTDMNLKNEVALPFKVVFNKDGYNFYEVGQKVNYKRELNIKTSGKLPKSGSVQINIDGTITVKNLTFGHFKCNQKNGQEIICDNK